MFKDKMSKRVLIISNNIASTNRFRLPLIKWLLSRDVEVHVLLFDRGDLGPVGNIQVIFHHLDFSNRALSPFKIRKAIAHLSEVIEKISPNLVLTYQIMPNVIGPLAVEKSGTNCPIISTVEGRGNPFIDRGLKATLVRKAACFLLKQSFKISNYVYFLNNDDATLFSKEFHLVADEKIRFIDGVGLDLDKFYPKGLVFNKQVVMVARLLKNKGVFDFVKCAEIVKKAVPESEFVLVGPEGDVKEADLKPYIDSGVIRWAGEQEDVRPYYWDSDLCCLPSYGEGFGLTLAEANACGRGCLAYDVPGCRKAIRNGINGFLVEEKNIQALADKIIELLGNKDTLRQLGDNGILEAKKRWSFENAEKDFLNQISGMLK